MNSPEDPKSSSKSGKPFPLLKTDAEAAHFVDTANLSEYDFSGFKPVGIELEKKT